MNGASRAALLLLVTAFGCESTGPSGPTIGVSLSAPAATIKQGDKQDITVTLTRSNYGGEVTLAAGGLPIGVTATFTPATLSGDALTTTVSLAAADYAAVGLSTVTIQATGSGVEASTVPLALTVGVVLTPVSIDFCADRLNWAAFQNAGGQWVRLTPDANNTVTFHATSRVGFATVEPLGADRYHTRVRFLAGAELKKLSDLPCQDLAFADHTVTVTGLAKQTSISVPTEHGSIAAERNPAFLTFLNGKTTTDGYWPTTGIADMIATRETETRSTNSSFWNTDRVAIRRAVDLSIPQSFDYTSSDFKAPTPIAYSINGANGGEAMSAELWLYTNAFLSSLLSTQTRVWTPAAAPKASGTIPCVPASLLVDTDVHQFTFTSNFAVDTLTTSSRTVISTFKDPTDQALSLGPALNSPTFTKLSSSGPLRYQARVASQTAYAGVLTLLVSNVSGNLISVDVTAAYLNGLPVTWDVSVPDFTGIAGWSSAYNLEPGRTTTLRLIAASEFAPTYKLRSQLSPGVARSAQWQQRNVIP